MVLFLYKYLFYMFIFTGLGQKQSISASNAENVNHLFLSIKFTPVKEHQRQNPKNGDGSWELQRLVGFLTMCSRNCNQNQTNQKQLTV